MNEDDLFERGLAVRREVLGPAYVDANLGAADEFMMPFQRLLTEFAWGAAWSRPGLDPKTRSIVNLAMLTALGRFGAQGARRGGRDHGSRLITPTGGTARPLQ